MAMLNFKYGLHQNLPGAITNGTIYVTSDEHAMYVDLANERIRISQIVTCTFAEWQNLTPPYSTEAFYYIIDKNALLKYNEAETTDAGYTTGWVQINSTKALQDEIDALEVRVKAIEDAKYGDKITSIQGDITNLQEKDEAHSEAISGLISRADGIDAKILGLNKAIGYHGAYGAQDTLPTLTAADKNTIAVHGNAVKIWDGAEWQDYNDIVQEIEDLKIDLKKVSESVASNETLTALTQRVTDLETWQKDAKTAIETTLPTNIAAALKAGTDAQATADSAKEIAEAARDAIADKENGLAAAHTKIAGVKATAEQALEIAQAAVTDDELSDAIKDFATKSEAEEYAKAVQGDTDATVKELEDRLDDGTTGLSALNQQIINVKQTAETAVTPEEMQDAIKDFATDDELANAKTDILGEANYNGTVKGAYEAASGAQGTANEAKQAASDNAALIRGLDAELDAEVEAREKAIADLKAEIESDMQTADAMVFIDTVASASELPEAGEEVAGRVLAKGWTYKASEEFVIGEGDDAILVHIGDLLIASGTETDGVLTSVEWKHIPSGYIADYNPEMTVVDNGSNNVSVKLTSGVNKDDSDTTNDGDLGKVNFAAAEGSAVTVSAVAGQVSIGMEWASFDPPAAE